jgi:hypothetical protein
LRRESRRGLLEVMPVDGRVDALVDALYALPLQDFIAGRKRLSDDLKKAGDLAGAAEVKQLIKPTLSAWVTNQTVRRAPDSLHRLTKVTDTLASAQRALGRAGEHQQDFHAALAEQRQVIGQLVEVARGILAERGRPVGDAVVDAVEKNLRWGPVSRDARTSFVQGRLTSDVAPPGFAALLIDGTDRGGKLVPPKQPEHRGDRHAAPEKLTGSRQQEREKARVAAEARQAREAEIAALHMAWREARAQTSDARRSLERTEKVCAGAQAKAAEAEERLLGARGALSAAEKSREEARDKLSAREKEEASARDRLTAAERAGNDAGKPPR